MLQGMRLQVSRLQFYAARGEALPFIATLQPRMVTAAAALQVSSELHQSDARFGSQTDRLPSAPCARNCMFARGARVLSLALLLLAAALPVQSVRSNG